MIEDSSISLALPSRQNIDRGEGLPKAEEVPKEITAGRRTKQKKVKARPRSILGEVR